MTDALHDCLPQPLYQDIIVTLPKTPSRHISDSGRTPWTWAFCLFTLHCNTVGQLFSTGGHYPRVGCITRFNGSQVFHGKISLLFTPRITEVFYPSVLKITVCRKMWYCIVQISNSFMSFNKYFYLGCSLSSKDDGGSRYHLRNTSDSRYMLSPLPLSLQQLYFCSPCFWKGVLLLIEQTEMDRRCSTPDIL